MMQLLETTLPPVEAAGIHRRSHQKTEAGIIRGNNGADRAAK